MRIHELIQQELKDTQPFRLQKTDSQGLIWTAVSHGHFDLTVDVQSPQGRQIAYATFEIDEYPDSLNSLDTWVDTKWRRMGIATRMYDWARELGNDIEPSKFLSVQGQKFWRKRNPERMKGHRVKGPDRAHSQELAELFEPSSAYASEWESSNGQTVARSYDDQGRLIETWFIEFKPGWIDFEFNRAGSMAVTGHGSEHRVFATVLANAEEYLKTHAPEYIVFSGGEDNRQSLYARMAQRLSQSYGYQRLHADQIPVREFRGRKIFVLKRLNGEAPAQKTTPAKQQRS